MLCGGRVYKEVTGVEKDMQAAVFAYAAEQYGIEPEYLWVRSPDHAVLRRTGSRKWFGLFGHIPRGKLGLAGEGSVSVMVVKCDPLLIGAVRRRTGILPGYHMDKAHWITVLLDGTVPEEEVLSLLDRSYTLAGAAAPRAKRDKSSR